MVPVTFGAINTPGVLLGCLQLCRLVLIHWLLLSHKQCHASATDLLECCCQCVPAQHCCEAEHPVLLPLQEC